MPTVGDRLQAEGFTERDILALFRRAQEKLIDAIARSPSTFAAQRRGQLEAINTIIRRLEQDIGSWTSVRIPYYVNAGANETADLVRALRDPGFGFRFAGVNKAAVKVLTDAAANEFGSTITAFKQSAMKAYFDKRKLQEDIITGVIQGDSVYKTQSELVQSLRDNGIRILRGNNRRFEPVDYANMLVRTQTMNAYNIGARTTLMNGGRKFVKVPTLRPDLDGPDICNEYEKKKYLDLERDPMPPWHPRCRHAIIPVSFAELRRERPDLYQQAVGFYEKAGNA